MRGSAEQLLPLGDAGLVLVTLLVGLEQRMHPLREDAFPKAEQIRAEGVPAARLSR